MVMQFYQLAATQCAWNTNDNVMGTNKTNEEQPRELKVLLVFSRWNK